MPTAMEEYLFDLRGYLILEGAVDADHVAEMNAIVDTYTDLEPGEWRGWGGSGHGGALPVEPRGARDPHGRGPDGPAR